jgi:hypothetical protein
MSEISSIDTALRYSQIRFQNAMDVVLIKQAAQAEKLLADMLAKNTRSTQELQTSNGRLDIYV